jgi:hypothetical protein
LSKLSTKQKTALLALKAQDGRTAEQVAHEEENVVAVIQLHAAGKASNKTREEEDAGLRQRKATKKQETTSVEDVD